MITFNAANVETAIDAAYAARLSVTRRALMLISVDIDCDSANRALPWAVRFVLVPSTRVTRNLADYVHAANAGAPGA